MAQAPQSPLKAQQLMLLSDLGISSQAIKFTNVTAESSRFIVVREDTKVHIVSVATKKATALPVTVDSAIMNPITNIMGLRAKNNLQIYNLDLKSRMKTTETTENVLYWKWLDGRTIAFVTSTAVYHWSVEGDATPEKKFEIVPEERQVQIINYDASKDGNWLFLQGIAKNAETQKIEGVLQLYSVAHKRYQPKMNAHGGCFAEVTLSGRDSPSTFFCFTRPDGNSTKLFIVEVGGGNPPHKVQTEVPFQNANDFVVSMVPSNKYRCLYAFTQAGFIYLFDILKGKCLFNRQVSRTTLFLAVGDQETGGVLTIDRNGQVATFNVDENNLIPYVIKVVGDQDLGEKYAEAGLGDGGDEFLQQKFDTFLREGNVTAAAELAAKCPALRNEQTIAAFKKVPSQPNQPPPDLQYYQLLLKQGPLNKLESVELCRRILQFKPDAGKPRIEQFLKENKLEKSEELGDVLAPHDVKLAATVYFGAKVPQKTILCFIQLGQAARVVEYCKQENYTPKWPELLAYVQQMRREGVKEFAQTLVEQNFLSAADVLNTLLGGGRNDVEKATEFLLDYLRNRGDREEDAELQTKLLEINLRAAPQVAKAILESEEYKFSHFDKQYVARLCESARLFDCALQLFENLEDIKRVLQMGLGSNAFKPDFLLKFFGDLTPEDALSCLKDLLKYSNTGPNLQLVVEVAKRYAEQLTVEKLVQLFEEFECWPGLYLFLGSMVNTTENKEVVFKYIQAAAEVGQVAQIELICRENDHYDPDQVKAFLLESNKIKDPRPLIHVCDRHGYVDELTSYLYTNQLYRFIEVYVQRMNPGATPKVVGSLIDLNAPEDQIRNLINTVRPPQCPVKELVEEVEKRVRLTLLLPWLESRYHEGLEDVALHNALAKIYIDINNNPQHFLLNNKFYDSTEVGKYCESRDPHLAFVAYKRAAGKCDKELVDITNKHGFFKDQARYCVERQNAELWALVLAETNEQRRSLIDQVVSAALPESRNPDEVSTTVKAFMTANLPNELIELLERIVLSNSADYNFRNNKNLQNLLVLTAIKADPTRVAGYIERLDNYDGPDLASICISAQYKLYEEGFLIYKKFKKGVEAVKVLLDDLGDLERGAEFAQYWDKPEVWSLLGKAQLDKDMVTQSIESFLKAEDATHYEGVILKANKTEDFKRLVDYLLMARSKVKEKTVDSELIYAYARLGDLSALEQFIAKPNSANLDKVGDRCFSEKIYPAARIIFSQINNYAKLATTLVCLELFQEAVEAARQANSIQTWKDVCYACVEHGKFRLAQMCGVNIIVFMDHLQELIQHYENGGHFAELIALLEQGINLDRAHQGIYTHLGILYAKYKEKKLMEHINLFWNRINIPTLLQACKDNLHWKETVFLYTHYDQFDNAVDTMIAHSPSCWDHEQFKSIIVRASNTEVFYRAINFYLREHPLFLSELLNELSGRLDHKRVVQTIDMSGQLPLIMPYLQHVQRENNKVVNEAINGLLVEEENYEALRESIHDYDNFDQIQLALTLQKHDRLEFRRIAAQLYRRNTRWNSSLDLSKQDRLWQDAMETGAASGDKVLAEELLRFFVSREDCPRSCFAACLYTCYPLIHPDVVLELAWRHDLMEFCMPFMVQTFRAMSTKMDALSTKVEKTEIQAQEQKEKEQKQENDKIEQNAGLLTATPLMIGYVPESQYAQTASQIFGGASNVGVGGGYAPTANPYGARPWG